MRRVEEILHLRVCDFLRKNYPEVIFRTDFASGMKMTIGQASKHKKFQKSRAWPDLFVAERGFGDFNGLFLELKADGVKIFKKDGTLRKNQHFEEQFEMLAKLRQRGYRAEFAVGFDEAVRIIKEYLGEPEIERVEF